jgi:hypothetical protein
MNKFVIDEDMPILVELALVSGTRGVSSTSQDLEQKSTEALNSAMNTIHQMATHIVATMDSVSESSRPSKVETTFGLKLTSEGNALIVKGSLESNINVTLTWELKKEIISNLQISTQHI